MPYNDPYGYSGNTAYAPPPPLGRHGGPYPPQPDIYGGGHYDHMPISRHGRGHGSRSRSKHSGSHHSSRHRGRGYESSDESSQSSSGSSVDSASTGATSFSSYLSSLRGSRKSSSRRDKRDRYDKYDKHDKYDKRSSRSSKYSDSENESPSESEYSESEDDDRKRKPKSKSKKRSRRNGERRPIDNLIAGGRGAHAIGGAFKAIRGKKESGISPWLDTATGLAGLLSRVVGGQSDPRKKSKLFGKVRSRDGRVRKRR